MIKGKFQTFIQIQRDLFLHYNSISDSYLLLDEANHLLYENTPSNEVCRLNQQLYQKLVAGQYYIEEKFCELDHILNKRMLQKQDTNMYHIVINTTLDCNLRCWYCYESKFKGSQIKVDILEAIKKNIELHYHKEAYEILKLSFFGGEPFMNFKAIKQVLSFAQEFCLANRIKLTADFTTNATLINKNIVDYLKNFNCMFQITLDGNCEQHNKVKVLKGIDTFQLAIDNIHQIENNIPESKIWVRINYDADTLKNIDSIFAKLNDLNRKKVYIMLRKIWQVPSCDICSEDLLSVIQKGIDLGFILDCYPLNPRRMCFAEYKNQVLINFDGKVFKCSTISAFDDAHSLGKLNTVDGSIEWENKKIQSYDETLSSKRCENCPLFGTCYGACTQKLLKNRNDNFCILDGLGLSIEQFLMYNFKLSLLHKKIFG
ncbi:uncharacterized protein SAMN05216455_103197 [Segatella bryantii]|jgi:uncharacterized protein|nr:radical SAM protein [Segatella bryantii]SEA10947.1 uncharacterized protein SAMN05216455_103197 [Segatella bryantii]